MGAKQGLSVLNPWNWGDVVSNIHLAIENNRNNGGKKVLTQAKLVTQGLQDQFSFRRKRNHQSYPAMNPVSYTSDCPKRMNSLVS